MHPWPDNGPREFVRIDDRDLDGIVIHCKTLVHGHRRLRVNIPRFHIHVNKQSSTVTLLEPEVISTLKRSNLLVNHYIQQIPECVVGSIVMVRQPHQAYLPQRHGEYLEYDLFINSGRPNRMTVVCARPSNGYAYVWTPTTEEMAQARQWPGMLLRTGHLP